MKSTTDLARPFVDAAKDVFNSFNIETRTGISVLIDKQAENVCDLSGIIGLSGDAVGAVVVSMEGEVAKLITQKALSKDDVSKEEIDDAIGEIVNMIAGNAKEGLEEYRIVISLPTMVGGKNHTISWRTDGNKIISISFRMEGGKTFYLLLALEASR